ncbi:MAG: class I SAM-dependent methyltransferase, partial [Bacilli bacterium]|nr:class I SAM-dependent methyltransferase [Bacilli bacterium]
MKNVEMMKVNQDGWNALIKNKCNHSNTSLPEYGPFMENEEKLQLFCDVKDKTVLELGCAAGKSLEYLCQKGASEVWGLDISEEQIKKAKELNIENSHFVVGPMEESSLDIPKNHFDYVLSMYSIGFCSDIEAVFQSVSEYLKKDGKFILCWTHPFFNTLKLE